MAMCIDIMQKPWFSPPIKQPNSLKFTHVVPTTKLICYQKLLEVEAIIHYRREDLEMARLEKALGLSDMIDIRLVPRQCLSFLGVV
jgi:hypothetical protein